MPYGAYLQTADHESVAVALVVAAARGGCDSNLGQFPLEGDTPIGQFLTACRTGDKSFLRRQAGTCPDIELRATYGTLLNAQSVRLDPDAPTPPTTDALIAYARAELGCYGATISP